MSCSHPLIRSASQRRSYEGKSQLTHRDQAGFILNLQNHWFTLRRFKFNSRWYNLNSFLRQPEWISPTYLQLVLAQAEAEGYSVFVIRKAGAGAGDNAEIDPGEAAGWGDGGVADFPSSGADLMVEEMGHARGRMSGSLEKPVVDDAGPSTQAGRELSGWTPLTPRSFSPRWCHGGRACAELLNRFRSSAAQAAGSDL